MYHQGKLLIEHGFIWDYYEFRSLSSYSVADKNIIQSKSDRSVLPQYSGELSFEAFDDSFDTINQQLYYPSAGAKVSLTDKLDLAVMKNKEDTDTEIEFTYATFSPDQKKLLFGAIVGFGDLPHGPYCIANIDGSNQMILKQSDIASSRKPAWLSNNRVIFIDNNDTLFVANNNDGSNTEIAKNVSSYVAR